MVNVWGCGFSTFYYLMSKYLELFSPYSYFFFSLFNIMVLIAESYKRMTKYSGKKESDQIIKANN